ncbi:MAG: hypothetical protein WCC17_19595 [Candidatus Nitrosopolaris sp.]
MWFLILAIWGCIPEITKACIDMTNSSSTYLGIAGGVAIGAVNRLVDIQQTAQDFTNARTHSATN